LAWQEQRHPVKIDLGLQRVRRVADLMQLLPVLVPVVTVAGTNGKGSTATCVSAMLQAQGLHVGLFTSPHLTRYSERIRVDAAEASDAALCASFERIHAAGPDVSLTFFEYNALAALDVFREARVDVMVLEVGLGGRLDAVNIVDADVAVVCSIGLDHMDWLGDTVEAIGAEKAGIFRDGRPVVLGMSQSPDSVLSVARELHCPLVQAGRDFQWRVQDDGCWVYQSGADLSQPLGPLAAPALPGEIQYRNAATALAALQALHSCRPEVVAKPRVALLDAALKSLHLPGRLQCVPAQKSAGRAEWLLDVAHNEPAAAVLADELRRRAPAARTVAVLGMLADKDVVAVVNQLDDLVDEWLLCTVGDARGLSAQQLSARLGATRGSQHFFESVAAACEAAQASTTHHDRVLVCGSFHVVGPALQWLGLY
jgi:dihydrofolate synthase/folylpolyglutamate synthase